MPRTRNHVYYRVNDLVGEVEVLLVWNAIAEAIPMCRTPSTRVTVSCTAVRWLSGEPQPGWVEYQLIDADGVTFDKPIHGGWEAMGPTANYPVASSFDCEVVRTETDAPGETIIVISTLNPNGLESSDGKSEFRVRQSQSDS